MVGSSFCEPDGRAGHADLAQTGAEVHWPVMNDDAAGGAALLGVVVGEDHPFLGDPVDVRRAIAHQAHRVGADVRLADVVAEDDQDVGLLSRLGHGQVHQLVVVGQSQLIGPAQAGRVMLFAGCAIAGWGLAGWGIAGWGIANCCVASWGGVVELGNRCRVGNRSGITRDGAPAVVAASALYFQLPEAAAKPNTAPSRCSPRRNISRPT